MSRNRRPEQRHKDIAASIQKITEEAMLAALAAPHTS